MASSLQGSGQGIQWQLELQSFPSFTVLKENLLSGFVVVAVLFHGFTDLIHGGQDNPGYRLLLICLLPLCSKVLLLGSAHL